MDKQSRTYQAYVQILKEELIRHGLHRTDCYRSRRRQGADVLAACRTKSRSA